MRDGASSDSDIGRVYRSLNNSESRKAVLGYLCSIYPEVASIDDISQATTHNKVDVIGSLIGYRMRYRKQDSLVAMGLATCAVSTVDGKPVQMFSATLPALDIKERLNEYEYRSHSEIDSGLLKKLGDKLWKR